ncbi:MAG: hypothetical protein RMN51_06295 [Verrucomicrobiota bacterium]|nr:hypothetical protein [Limisphaera sp.]MDW8381701.1 hypothetical protein [Verrucomicrobiota bacterium]
MKTRTRPGTRDSWLWPGLWVVLACLCLGSLGLGYVWLKNQVDQLGRQIKQREQRLTELRSGNERLRRQLATLHSPRFLEQRVRELQLGLEPAHPSQVWRLTDPQGWTARKDVAGSAASHEPDSG